MLRRWSSFCELSFSVSTSLLGSEGGGAIKSVLLRRFKQKIRAMGGTKSKSKTSDALRLCKGREKTIIINSRGTILPTKAENSDHQKSLWSDLPIDLLIPIAERLALIDLLSFRAVCKHWRSASSTASAKIESANKNPCILLYGEGSKCTFVHQKLKKKYTIDMPELQGATCLASYQGWLLLFQEGCIIFFCPFSRAKIYLPKIPDLENIEGHVAGFSAPPTCIECVVVTANRRFNEDLLELNVLTRGAEMWAKYEKPAGSLGEISAVNYCDGIFYFCEHNNFVATFTLKDKDWKVYRLLKESEPRAAGGKSLPFRISRENYGGNMLNNWIEEDNVGGACLTVPICGTVVTLGEYDWVINNENVKSSDSNDNSKGCSNLKGVLIQPRFFQTLPSQSWLDL